jgi:hypothetical protein
MNPVLVFHDKDSGAVLEQVIPANSGHDANEEHVGFEKRAAEREGRESSEFGVDLILSRVVLIRNCSSQRLDFVGVLTIQRGLLGFQGEMSSSGRRHSLGVSLAVRKHGTRVEGE